MTISMRGNSEGFTRPNVIVRLMQRRILREMCIKSAPYKVEVLLLLSQHYFQYSIYAKIMTFLRKNAAKRDTPHPSCE